MPQGDKSSYTDKQKRQAEHIEAGYENQGFSLALFTVMLSVAFVLTGCPSPKATMNLKIQGGVNTP